MQSFDFKKFLPHLLIIGGFALIALLFCYPVLEGKKLTQHDVQSWEAAAHEGLEWKKNTGENPLWTNSMFGGMPTYTIYTGTSNNFLGHVYSIAINLLPKPANFLVLAMLCFYVLMHVLRINRWLGVVGAVAFAFSSYTPIIIGAGHETKMIAIAFLPLVLAGLILLFRGKYIGGGALFGIGFSFMLSTNHFQTVYYAAMILLLAGLALLIKGFRENRAKQTLFAAALSVVLLALAIGTCLPSIWPTAEYGKETMRGGASELTFNHDKSKKGGGLDKDYAFQWSFAKGESFTILVPYLYGGATVEPAERLPQTNELLGGQYEQLPSYWGPQVLGISGPVYFGAIVCFLFVLGLLVVRSPHKWWIAGLCALAIVMAWGNNFKDFNYWLFDHLPMFNKFRIPSMIMIIPQFLFPLLGIWAVNDILSGKIDRQEVWKKTVIALGITAGLAFLVGVCGSMFFDFTNPETDKALPAQLLGPIKDDRAAMARNSGIRSIVFILLAGVLIWLFVKERIKSTVLIAGLGLLIAIDLIPVSLHYLNEDKYVDADTYDNTFTPRPVDAQILQDKDPYYRVLDITTNIFNDAMPAYYHKLVGGYSAAKLEIYQDMIEVHMNGRFNTQVLNMLNTKYLIVPAGQGNQQAVMPNPDACGNAWFVSEAKLVGTADDEILALKAPALGDTVQVPDAFDAKKTAIIRKTFEKELTGYTFGKDSASSIRLDKYGVNNLAYTSNNAQNGLAVFSDIWYPHGWKAYIDGKEVPIIRTNYILRALKIPAGQHKIEFRFRPQSYEKGNTIALFSSVLLLLAGVTGLYLAFKGKKEDAPAQETAKKA